MNKKIKIIELLNKIANGEEVPKKIKYDNEVFVYIGNWEQYVTEEEEIPLLRRISAYNYSGLNDEVEILEDNTEEIILTEKIFVPMELNLTDYDKSLINNCFESQNALINQLVRAVNKLRKEKE